jgi:hypothetical protein
MFIFRIWGDREDWAKTEMRIVGNDKEIEMNENPAGRVDCWARAGARQA